MKIRELKSILNKYKNARALYLEGDGFSLVLLNRIDIYETDLIIEMELINTKGLSNDRANKFSVSTPLESFRFDYLRWTDSYIWIIYFDNFLINEILALCPKLPTDYSYKNYKEIQKIITTFYDANKIDKKLSIMRQNTPEHVVKIIDDIWAQKDKYIKWPKEPFLFMPGVIRQKFHKYSIEQTKIIKEAGLTPDNRSNGPAVMSFLIAGGERPNRFNKKRKWNIHHIYDGHFPFPGKETTTHAVKEGDYFTQSAGLVAIHPIAEALADEIPYFAWLLRYEAYIKFSFDPDYVFTNSL